MKRIALVVICFGFVFLLCFIGISENRRPIVSSKVSIKDSNCLSTYLDFYRNSEIHIAVLFGYKDSSPARFVSDRYERMNFVQSILKPCNVANLSNESKTQNPDRTSACGFEREIYDTDLFQKKIFGPDHKWKTVRLRVTHSSVGPDDEENRRNPYQSWQSQYAQTLFSTELKTADAVFYNGHSRAGGGPDFQPPKLKKNRHVSYEWYKKHQPGLMQILTNLSSSPLNSPLKVLGLLSCASTRHFSHQILKLNPTLNLITNENLIYFSDAQTSLLSALSALLEMKCSPELGRKGL